MYIELNSRHFQQRVERMRPLESLLGDAVDQPVAQHAHVVQLRSLQLDVHVRPDTNQLPDQQRTVGYDRQAQRSLSQKPTRTRRRLHSQERKHPRRQRFCCWLRVVDSLTAKNSTQGKTGSLFVACGECLAAAAADPGK